MPSWFTSTFARSSKHSSPTASTSSSAASTPLDTPTGSTIWSAPGTAAPEPESQPQSSRRRLRRKRKDAQPGPVGPRLSSLFFPPTSISTEQEDKCIYRASHAASLSDLLSGQGGRPVSGFWGKSKQINQTTLDLPLTSSSSSYSTPVYPLRSSNRNCLSVGDFSTLVEESQDNPYLVLAPLYPSGRKQARKSVDYTSMLENMTRKERAYSTSGKGIERGTEIWSSPFDSDTDLPSTANMAPPPVPARSTLRPTASASNLRDRFSKSGPSSGSTPFTLPVDPIPVRPVNSTRQTSPEVASRPQMTPSASSTSTESAFSVSRKRRPAGAVRGGSISGDPNRIKDGAAAKGSSSGVYTPPTFPGPIMQQAPQPSSSRVYTPATFSALSPTVTSLPLPSPSRSTSVSSTSTVSSVEVTTPRTPHTPLTPSSRFLGAVSGGWGSLKRASGALSTRSAATPSPSYTPTSAREGYFPSTIYESSVPGSTATGPSFWPTSTPSTPASAGLGKPYGLGLGLGTGPEDSSYRRSRSETVTSEKFGGVLVGEVPKGKRKPVPRPAGQEEIKEEENEEVVGYAM